MSSLLIGLRERIDVLDEELVRILNDRAELVHAVGKWKSENQKQVYDPTREKFILDRVARLNQGPLCNSEIQEMMSLLIRGFRQFESRVRAFGEKVEAHPIQKVSIIGIGLMGGSLALALGQLPQFYELIGFDPNPPKESPAGRAIHSWAGSAGEALQADIVILAMPVLEIIRFLKKYSSEFRPGSIVMDIGSTKQEICETAWQLLDSSVTFVGGHPLAGKALAGAKAAQADLFLQKPFVLVPGVITQGIETLEKMIRLIGARPWLCDAKTHDRILAYTSHLPQMVSTALTLTVAEALVGKEPVIHGPALREMTRLAESDGRMWQDIVRTNGKPIDEALGEMIAGLTRLRKTLKQGGLTQKFKAAKKARTLLFNRQDHPNE